MKILITGATGFIGRHLSKKLVEQGHRVVIVSRNRDTAQRHIQVPCEIFQWQADHEEFPQEAFQGVDGVVNLAGENLGEGRWTQGKMKKIYDSRIEGTRKLVDALNKASQPQVFISSSAIGYYGNRGDEVLNEDAPAGSTFLAYVCKDWEHEAFKAKIRTVVIRTGIVLDKTEGALPQLLRPFKMGVGAVVDSGDQWMSWISVDDFVSLIIWALQEKKVGGPVNAVAPQPVTNKDFSKALADALRRPLWLKAPGSLFKIFLGQKAQVILDSQRVSSQKIEDLGFKFSHRDLPSTFVDLFRP